MASLIDLRRLVSRRLDQDLVSNDIPTDLAKASFWTREDVTAWLNEAYNQMWTIVAEAEAKSLVTETDGTYAASARSMSLWTILGITDDPLKIEEVRDATGAQGGDDGRLIEHAHRRTFGMWDSGIEPTLRRSSSLGWGQQWDYYGYSPMRIEVRPVPTTALTLRIRYIPSVPTALSADRNVPVAIVTAHHSLLVEYAVIKAYQKEESGSQNQQMKNWEDKLSRFRESIEERQFQSSRHVQPTDSWDYQYGGRQ